MTQRSAPIDVSLSAGAPISTGKHGRLSRLADAQGRFAMLAIDQRGSLRRMLRRSLDAQPEACAQDALRLVKRIVTESVAPLATAVLTDPLYGYPASRDVVPPGVGVLLALEATGYEAAGDQERLSRLIEGWSARQVLESGADAVKLLIWHNPEASAATHRHQHDVVRAVGEACQAIDMPFVLEVVTYPLGGADPKGPAHARLKPELVIDAAATYSAPRFGVDLLKVEFPANLKFTEEYQRSGFGAGTAVYGLAEVQAFCRRLDAAAAAPWVILSAGVDPEEFVENVTLANAAGGSGFLCGRAVWKHVVDFFPDPARMQTYMQADGRQHFLRIREANAQAKPWHQHRRFRASAPLE